jgi:hypothetical protein
MPLIERRSIIKAFTLRLISAPLGYDDPGLRWHRRDDLSPTQEFCDRGLIKSAVEYGDRLRAVFLFGSSGFNQQRRHQA